MSLFSQADIDLPIVTQIMQVDLASPSEVHEFWLRCTALSSFAKRREGAKNYNLLKDYVYTEPTKQTEQNHNEVPPANKIGIGSYSRELDDEQISNIVSQSINNLERYYMERLQFVRDGNLLNYESNLFLECCQLIQELIRSLCDKKEISLTKLSQLRKIVQVDYILRPSINPEFVAEAQGHTDEWRIGEFAPGGYVDQWDSTYASVEAFEETLVNVWRGTCYLTRCQECENPFVSSKRNQRYCSHRCAARVGERRRRRERKKAPDNSY